MMGAKWQRGSEVGPGMKCKEMELALAIRDGSPERIHHTSLQARDMCGVEATGKAPRLPGFAEPAQPMEGKGCRSQQSGCGRR